MLDIVTAPNESYVEGGIDRGLGDEGLLHNCWSQALAAVDETFCLFPTDDTNCKDLDRRNLWASAAQRKPAKT